MKCPNCDKRAISFVKWGRGFAAFAYVCPHCGKRLRATPGTIGWFVFCLVLIPFFILAAERLSEHLRITQQPERGLIFAALFFPVVLAISFLVWKRGSYKLKDDHAA